LFEKLGWLRIGCNCQKCGDVCDLGLNSVQFGHHAGHVHADTRNTRSTAHVTVIWARTKCWHVGKQRVPLSVGIDRLAGQRAPGFWKRAGKTFNNLNDAP